MSLTTLQRLEQYAKSFDVADEPNTLTRAQVPPWSTITFEVDPRYPRSGFNKITTDGDTVKLSVEMQGDFSAFLELKAKSGALEVTIQKWYGTTGDSVTYAPDAKERAIIAKELMRGDGLWKVVAAQILAKSNAQ